jgi:AcrR family transcriptional regulator
MTRGQGPGRPRTKPADERRIDLLDAGQAVFVERGIAAARLDEITERAGVAKGTFYLYFESKGHLAAALRERVVDELIDHQREAVDRLPPEAFGARVDRWLEDAIRAYIQHADLHDLLFEHATASTPIHSGITPENRHIDALRDVLAARIDPPADAPDADTAAILIYAAFHGAAHYLLHERETDRVDAIIAATQQLARRYLLIESV